MDNLQFCYWLKGYFEIGSGGNSCITKQPYLSMTQLDIVHDHIELVSKETPWVCSFIQWLQGIIDGARILEATTTTELKNISRVIKLKLDDVFDKKTPERSPEIIGDGLQNPPQFPPLYVPDPLNRPEVTCSPSEAIDISWEDSLKSVLDRYPRAGGSSGKVFCAKED